MKFSIMHENHQKLFEKSARWEITANQMRLTKDLFFPKEHLQQWHHCIVTSSWVIQTEFGTEVLWDFDICFSPKRCQTMMWYHKAQSLHSTYGWELAEGVQLSFVASQHCFDLSMYLAYRPFHRQLQFQWIVQLHPCQAYPESFSTPQGVFSLEHGVNAKG